MRTCVLSSAYGLLALTSFELEARFGLVSIQGGHLLPTVIQFAEL
jgi:hypothetical protein